MSQRLLITNCRLYDAPGGDPLKSILVEDGVITEVGVLPDTTDCDVRIDAGGRTAAPGFIDVHIQGAGGADVLDATPGALEAISKTCARFGVTGFLATTVFRPGQDNGHLRLAAEHVGKDLGGAKLLGIHIEGPFISSEKRGMIQPGCICAPSVEVLDEIMELTAGQLRMMTIAPELSGGLDMTRRLVDAGVIASLGHTSATYEQTLEGFEAGITHVTHLFNAKPGIHHRAPGPLTAIFESDTVTAQLIPDGVHVHPAVVRMAYRLLGSRRVVAITDGMQAMGLPDGTYTYSGLTYESKDGAARYKDGTLIGTALGLSQLLGRLMRFTACSVVEAVETAAVNPARILGMDDRKGAVAVGKDADLVLLDADMGAWATIVAGEVVFQK